MASTLHKGDLPDDLDLGSVIAIDSELAPTGGIGLGGKVRLSMKVVGQKTGEGIRQEG